MHVGRTPHRKTYSITSRNNMKDIRNDCYYLLNIIKSTTQKWK
jgi:hypothetical protein